MGLLGAKLGKVGAILTPTNSFFLLGFLRLCQFWWKSIKKCDRDSARRRTDTRTHRQTQTDFIICPMLYAMAMGPIAIAYSMGQIIKMGQIKIWDKVQTRYSRKQSLVIFMAYSVYDHSIWFTGSPLLTEVSETT